MMTHTVVLEGPPPARDSIASPCFGPVLIRVPKLAASPSSAGRAPMMPRRGRRRLRREVRVAISALMFAMPMSWALMSFAKLGPERERAVPLAVAVAPSAEDRPFPMISGALEATVAAPEPEPPMVLPAGYLLPDDRAEGSPHAGN